MHRCEGSYAAKYAFGDRRQYDFAATSGYAAQPGRCAICFAYATADMISQRVQTEISALDVATKYYLTNPLRLAKLANPDLQLISKEWGTIGQRLPKAGTQQMSRETITRIDTPISISMKGEKKKLLLCCIMLKGSVRTETSPLMTGTHTS